jgi:murein DD-endopeptidase MepM/ murein hydrolase activator NlpD
MRRKKGYGGIIFLMILIALIAGGVYVYTSSTFERNAPEITIDSNGYWNGRAPLKIAMKDQSGIVSYKISMHTGKGETVLDESTLSTPEHAKTFELKVPEQLIAPDTTSVTLEVTARDASRWNFFAGNRADKTQTLSIDARRPQVSIVTNSYKIVQGGSAIVVFRVEDEHLKDFYVETSFGKRFKAEPFYADHYYAALIAWPVTEENFRAYVVADDIAGNETRAYIPLRLVNVKYKVSKIKLSDRFLNGKVAELAQTFGAPANADAIQRFLFVNETLREKNEKVIQKLTSAVPDTRINGFTQKPFYPLRDAAVVARFGDHRFYYYKGQQVSEAYHLGLDLASVKMAKIVTKNPGEIVFADNNGIYGNMPVLAHGLGLYTIYGHCSSIKVPKGTHVNAGAQIATTGMSGYAMGDHLHFGVLVQGIEVLPQEWMDKHWIKVSITDVLSDAKKLIGLRK